jgi:hypothetical protein
MKRIGGLLLAGVMMSWVVRAETVANDPVAVTKAAYQVDLAHFGFDANTVQADKPYLAPELYAALMKKAHQPVAKGDAPDIEGDVLFDAQDVPDKYEVGAASLRGIKAEVPVSLRYGTEKRHYMVRLVQINGAWKIADVYYGKDGKLSDLLK